jgi:hypothetical protein
MSVISTSANLGSGSLRVSCAEAQLADIIITMAAKQKIFFIVLLAFAFMNRLQMYKLFVKITSKSEKMMKKSFYDRYFQATGAQEMK